MSLDSDFRSVVLFFSILSCLSSFGVIVTSLLFPVVNMFLKIIVYVSGCVFMGSLAISWGFPSNSGDLCVIQGGFQTFFFRCEFLWLLCFTIQLYSMVRNNKLFFSEIQMHAICWTVGILFELIPIFFHDHYGQDDTYSGRIPCYFRTGESHAMETFVSVISFFWFIIFIAVAMSILIVLVYYRLKTSQSDSSRSFQHFTYYPLITIVCWAPLVILATILNLDHIHDTKLSIPSYPERVVLALLASMVSLHGLFFALLYFTNSKDARTRWKKLFENYFPSLCKKSSPVSGGKRGGQDSRFSLHGLSFYISDPSRFSLFPKPDGVEIEMENGSMSRRSEGLTSSHSLWKKTRTSLSRPSSASLSLSFSRSSTDSRSSSSTPPASPTVHISPLFLVASEPQSIQKNEEREEEEETQDDQSTGEQIQRES